MGATLLQQDRQQFGLGESAHDLTPAEQDATLGVAGDAEIAS